MTTKEEFIAERQDYKTPVREQLRKAVPKGEEELQTLFRSLTHKEIQEWSLWDIKGIDTDESTLCYLVGKRRKMVQESKIRKIDLINEYMGLLMPYSASLDRLTDTIQNEVLAHAMVSAELNQKVKKALSQRFDSL